MEKIGAVLRGTATRPDRQPVRRHSHHAGRCEGTYWRSTDRQEVRRVLLAAKRYELAERTKGKRNGPLGHVGIEIIELLVNLIDHRTGRLEPSVAYLMAKLRRSKDAVVRALANLRQHGFLDWLRRYEPTGCEGRGPRVRQTSNAYRLSIPQRALRLLGIRGQPAPPPDDHDHDRQTKAMEIAAMKAGLPLDELALVEVDDDRLGRLLGELGRLVQQREYAKLEEHQSTAS